MNIEPQYLEAITDILRKYACGSEVWAYGSRVRGTNARFSDVDLVLRPKENMSFERMCKLKLAFEESDLPMSVDVHCWDNIPESFKEQIIKEYETIING
jgi:uncharacterized protein